MTKLVCEKNLCCGCYACVEVCPKQAITIKDNLQFMSAEIDENICIECNMCQKICPNIQTPTFIEPLKWYQGWAGNSEIRATSSSGGLARSISEQFIYDGGVVCSCLFENGRFVFKIVSSVDRLNSFQGSKYVKSNPKSCYREILKKIKGNQKVLFIGLPCQVSAVKNYIGNKYADMLTTIDLICHGTPSVKLLEQFFSEHGYSLAELERVSFRKKGNFVVEGNQPITVAGIMDEYSIAFLSGSCYTENCYRCQYAKKERVSDITLGDSWGTEIVEEASKGISLILCQTTKGLSLLEKCDVVLRDVDLAKAISANHQLRVPSSRPPFLDSFFVDLKKGRSFKVTVFKYCRKKYIKQQIKKILIKLHIYRF